MDSILYKVIVLDKELGTERELDTGNGHDPLAVAVVKSLHGEIRQTLAALTFLSSFSFTAAMVGYGSYYLT